MSADSQSELAEDGLRCKFCWRARAQGSALEVKWRRPRGKECSACPAVLKTAGWVAAGKTMADIEQTCAKDLAFRARLTEASQNWDLMRSKKPYSSATKRSEE